MPIKTVLSRSVKSFFVYVALVVLSLIFSTQSIDFFIGVGLSLTTISLLLVVYLYSTKESLFAAFIIFGIAVLMGTVNVQTALIQIAAFFFISLKMKNNPEGLISHTLIFWIFIGTPFMIIPEFIRNRNIDEVCIFMSLREITNAFISSILVDILMTYGPFKRILRGNITKTNFHFSYIMVHTSLVAVTIPYLFYINVTGYNSTKGIVDFADSRFITQLQTIESYFINKASNDLFALKHQGLVQVLRLNQELTNISADTGTEIVITDMSNRVMGSNLDIIQGEHFNWQLGGSIAYENKNINYWLPDGSFRNKIDRWRYAYIIRENELGHIGIKVIMMMPYYPFLSNILKSYISQLWVYMFFCLSMIILSRIFNRIFFQPLVKLAQTTTGIPAQLADGHRIEWHKSSIVEIDALADNFKSVADNLKGMFQSTQRLAYYDLLTGLPNRLSMQDTLAKLFTNRSSHETFALLFFDLDRFKQVNDSLGHAVGDQLLKEVALRLTKIESENIRFFRVSGDEFVAIGEKMDQEGAENIAKEILDLIRQPVWIDKHELHITSSIGIALYPQHGENAETLMRLADASMYFAKEDGRNTYSLYTQSLQTRLEEQMWIENQLRKALDNNQLVLFYQPIVDGVTSEIRGMEALIRWKHTDKGFISPMEFISIAEQSGLIIPLGQWVLREACMQNKKWQELGLPKVRIAVNLSGRQFYSGRITEDIQMILEESGLEPKYLELEITEGFMIKDPGCVNSVLKQLKEMGVTVSIDDFGTGYSSLVQLKHFPVNVVKIDKSFVHNIRNDQNNRSIVRAIIELAHSMNLKVIGEGVETESERDFLRMHYCDEMQGYYFGKPMNGEEFALFWKKWIDKTTIIGGLRY